MPSHEEDVSALAARIGALEDVVRMSTQAVDEKALKELRRALEAVAKRDPKFEGRVTNKVEVLAERVETVAKTVSTTSAALAAKDGEIAQLRRDLEGTLLRINGAVAQANGGAGSAELAEMRRALDELTKLANQRMPRGLEHRVDELAAKFDVMSQRVDSVSSTISTTAAGLAGREGEVNALRRAFETQSDRIAGELAEIRRGTDPSAVFDLRQALKELAEETGRRQHAAQNQMGQTAAKVDALAQTVEAISASLASTTTRVAGTEDSLSAFRTYFEEAGGKLSALLAEHNRSLSTLSTRTAALEQADRTDAQASEDHLREVDGRLDRAAERLVALEQSREEAAQLLETQVASVVETTHQLAARLEPLSAEVAAAKERMDARDEGLAAMESRFHDAGSRVNTLAADLSRALADLPDRVSAEEAFSARIDEVAERSTSLADGLARLETTIAEQARRSVTSGDMDRFVDEQRVAVGALARDLDSLTSSLASTAGGVASVEGELVLVHEQVAVTERVSSLVADQQRLISELAARTSALEQGSDDRATQELDEQVASLSARLEGLARQLERSSAERSSTEARVSETEEHVSALRAYVEKAGSSLNGLAAEHTRLLAALGEQTAALEGRITGATTKLDERIAAEVNGMDELSAGLEALARRMDELTAGVASASSDHADEEQKLEALHHQVSESSSRIESIADDLRDALGAFPEATPDQLGELGARIDLVEKRVATVAAEVGRAKTLWPVALRSLEARLDDVAPKREHLDPAAADATDGDEVSERHGREEHTDDLLAGLRDSLQAMESVAAELGATTAASPPENSSAPEAPAHQAIAGGARVVPLRTTDP
jgi:chromosome segregation ATPase